MKLWWLTDFARVGAERAAVQRLAAEEGWFALTEWRIHAYRLCAEGAIAAHGVAYPVRLVFPDQFPSVPAWVEPQDPDARWSHHQFGKGGTLCLELRPDNWLPQATGADVLRSAYNLLRIENPLGDGDQQDVPSAHYVGEVQSYDWGEEPVLIGAGCLTRIRDDSAKEVRCLRWMAADRVWPMLVFDASDRIGLRRPPSADIETWRFDIPVIVAGVEPPVDSTPADRAALGHALGLDLGPGRFDGPLVVIAVGAECVVPYHSPDDTGVFARRWVVVPEDSGARSGRNSTARGKSVAVVGIGSVGSKISEMLVRSGIERLVLVDGDVFLPSNLERHILDWRDVGFRKAEAVKRRLLHIAPGADVEVIDTNLNWQRSARTHASQIETLAECSLIVDATGDTPTALLLGAVAAESDRALVSVEVFEGGLGAVVARSIPDRDPPYVAGRAAYISYCEQMNVRPPASGRRTYEALNEEGEPLVADDVAVTIAAAHAGRVILDILDGRVDSRAMPWLLIGCRTGWLFNGHGHTINLDVGKPRPSATPKEDAEAQAFALDLARKAADAAASSS